MQDTKQAADPSTTASEPSAAKQTITESAEANTIPQSASDSSTHVTTLKPPIVRPAVMPKVQMSSAHAADCIVRVGDVFPAFRLPDPDGRSRSLQEVQGPAMTVVVLWSSDRLLAEDQLRYLDERIAPYADLGVRAVAINVGGGIDEVRTTLDAVRLKTPVFYWTAIVGCFRELVPTTCRALTFSIETAESCGLISSSLAIRAKTSNRQSTPRSTQHRSRSWTQDASQSRLKAGVEAGSDNVGCCRSVKSTTGSGDLRSCWARSETGHDRDETGRNESVSLAYHRL